MMTKLAKDTAMIHSDLDDTASAADCFPRIGRGEFGVVDTLKRSGSIIQQRVAAPSSSYLALPCCTKMLKSIAAPARPTTLSFEEQNVHILRRASQV